MARGKRTKGRTKKIQERNKEIKTIQDEKGTKYNKRAMAKIMSVAVAR